MCITPMQEAQAKYASFGLALEAGVILVSEHISATGSQLQGTITTAAVHLRMVQPIYHLLMNNAEL